MIVIAQTRTATTQQQQQHSVTKHNNVTNVTTTASTLCNESHRCSNRDRHLKGRDKEGGRKEEVEDKSIAAISQFAMALGSLEAKWSPGDQMEDIASHN